VTSIDFISAREINDAGQKMARWAIAITRENGAEELAMFDPWIGVEAGYVEPVLRGMTQLNPELKGRLRIVPVVVDIREMTEEEESPFRKSSIGDAT
jgi:hypothetical protein